MPDPPHEPKRRKRMRRREHLGSYLFLTFSCYKRMQLFKNPAIRDAFASALSIAREKLASGCWPGSSCPNTCI
jgi:hypothetical protein